MNNRIHKKLQSSTLVEVLIGMTILMITMSIVFPMILKTQQESGVIQRTNAIIIGNTILEKMIATNTFEELELEQENYMITVEVSNDMLQETGRTVHILIRNKQGRELFVQDYYAIVE